MRFFAKCRQYALLENAEPRGGRAIGRYGKSPQFCDVFFTEGLPKGRVHKPQSRKVSAKNVSGKGGAPPH